MKHDFSQIRSGEDFELLCEDLLRAQGYTIVEKVGRGPDGGRDLVVAGTTAGDLGFPETHTYLVECKHLAKSNRAVTERDIGAPIARMAVHACDRYLLITSTVPTEKVVHQVKTIHETAPHYRGAIWARNDLVRLVMKFPHVWEAHVHKDAAEMRPKRTRLPSMRAGRTWEAYVGGHKIFVRVGEYPDGRAGELVLDMHKEGAAFRSLLQCFAMSVSLGLQHGIPLDEFVEQFTFTRFEPHGVVTGHPNVKFSTSLIDFVFRVLGFHYLDRTDFVQIKPEEVTAAPNNASVAARPAGGEKKRRRRRSTA